MPKGTVILLNGTSSAGKTSIARELQKIFPEPFLHIGPDRFMGMLPRKYFGINPPEDDFAQEGIHSVLPVDRETANEFNRLLDEEKLSYTQAIDRLQISERLRENGVTVHIGPIGQKLMSGMHHSIATLAAMGNHLIIDHVLQESAWLKECVDLLCDFKVLFVGVCCPIEIAEQRAWERGDRILGQAKGNFHLVHRYRIYDIEVDTSILTVEACASKIKERLEMAPPPDAFSRLKRSDFA